MKISQEKQFQPVSIILENEEEVAAMWDLVQSRSAYSAANGSDLTIITSICSKINNYFNDRKARLLS